MLKVLFLCTGNSCRSIIAEALLNHYGKGQFEAYSAGSFPTGNVNPDSLAVLRQHNIPDSGYKSQSWDEFSDINFDVVITVCDNAANETCPIYLGHAIKVHWGIPDPDKATVDREKAFADTFAILKSLLIQLTQLNKEKIDFLSLNKIGESRL